MHRKDELLEIVLAYRPSAIQHIHIPKPGTNETRPLGIPTVRDRIVQAALVNVIEPIFERDFAEHSYGFRPRGGCKDALRRVDHLLKAGFVHVVDADLKAYFDSIPHDQLLARLKTKIADGRVLSLIESFLMAGILDGIDEWAPASGAPQGLSFPQSFRTYSSTMCWISGSNRM